MSEQDTSTSRQPSEEAAAISSGETVGDLRPVVLQSDAMSLLIRYFSQPVRRLEPVEGGQVARTFSFEVAGEAYILRFNVQMDASFEKEAFIAGLVAPAGIPIPALLRHGRFGDLEYAMSQRMPGVPLIQLDRSEVEALTPMLVEMLDAIHTIDVSHTAGFAVAGDDGNGLFPSWRRFLDSVREEEPEWNYFGKWHGLFETTFLERDAFDRVYSRMERLLPYCPEGRQLIHGNFGFGNVLARDGSITAVLDWQDAGYGDALYDVAQLDFWDRDTGWADLFRDRYRSRGLPVRSFAERILCYQCRTGLDAMRFFARKRDEAAYRWTHDRLSDLGVA